MKCESLLSLSSTQFEAHYPFNTQKPRLSDAEEGTDYGRVIHCLSQITSGAIQKVDILLAYKISPNKCLFDDAAWQDRVLGL